MAARPIQSHYQATATRTEDERRCAYDRAAREVLFYQRITPHGSVPAPHLYFGAVDEEARCIVLVLEGCSPDQVAMVRGAMAPLHARWWGNLQLHSLSWLPRWGDTIPSRADRYRQSVDLFLSRFGEHVSAEVRRLIRGLADSSIALLTELAGAPTTVIHGDLHLDNVIFSSSAGDAKARVIDWQGAMEGPAILDVTFLTGVLSIPERRRWEWRLLQQYHARLVA